MIKEINYYIEKGHIKKKSPDLAEAESLLSKAKRRLKRIKNEKIENDNADLIFEDIYEVIRESGQSLMSKKGYKPYSHEATIAFIKEFYKEFNEYEINTFDRFRKIRNNSIYRGIILKKEDTKEILQFADKFLKKIIKIGL